MGSPHPGTAASERDVFRVSSVAAVAASIEYYDFFIYGTAAALVFPTLFFPEQSAVTALLLSFATFGVGFLARPLGGVVFGHFGDSVGRKKTLVVALVLMGVVSTAIGLLPTYATLGIAAPILLVVLRFVQGISLGGQMGGVVLLATEAAPARRRGFFGSFSSIGAPGGILLANLVFLLVTAVVSDEVFMGWAWRIPFLLSLAPIALALYVHVKLEDTPAFQRLQQDRNATAEAPVKPARSPIVTVLRTHPREVALAVGSYIGLNVTYYMFVTFVISYGTTVADVSRTTLLAAVLIGSLAQCVGLPLAGALSDRYGRRSIQMVGAAGTAAFGFVLFPAVQSGSFWIISLALVVGLGFVHSLMYGVQPAFFSEAFSTEVRYSGVSLGIQIASVIGGGFAPMIATALDASYGWTSVAVYMTVACAISFVAVHLLGRRQEATARATEPAGGGTV
ncbi:MHS family MFS transporter [Pseudonocardia sp. C8]|uniref:MFS transporter n=1 Tax=Pseudonocardia sp. C8 TaxID=2762759 RepID=UPI00164234DA|nr:MFS transporter [Pseudonocardia sp. C8]MBC3191740.1 MHS family MFS transporter [Pseudonocardia sp. C8]